MMYDTITTATPVLVVVGWGWAGYRSDCVLSHRGFDCTWKSNFNFTTRQQCFRVQYFGFQVVVLPSVALPSFFPTLLRTGTLNR